MDGDTMETLTEGENITKTKLLKRWPKDTKQKVWDSEDKKWKQIPLKKRITDTKFEIATVAAHGNGVVLTRLVGKSQKMHWVEFTQGTKSKPIYTVMTPHILPLDIGKPEEAVQQIIEGTAETLTKDEENPDTSALKDTDNLK